MSEPEAPRLGAILFGGEMEPEPNIVATAGETQAESSSTIDYYPPAEGEEEEAEVAEGEAEAEGTTEAPAAKAAPPSQAALPGPTPPIPPLPGAVPPEMAQYRQALEVQQRIQQQQAEELNQLRLDQELTQLRASWTAEGYEENQIQQGLAQHRQIRERETALAAREKAMEQTLSLSRANDQAKIQVAIHFSQISGMPFANLMKFDIPQLMEAEARAYKAEQALIKAQQGKVKPTRVASVGPGSQGANSVAHLREKYADGLYLTPEQVRLVVPKP